MSDPIDLSVKSALSAYWKFFETFNSRDGDTFTTSLQFPHLRISARNPAPQIIEQPKQHADGMDFAQIQSTGWDHTIGAEPKVTQVSLSKVHIKGGWTRYNTDAEPILTNSVTYIVTLVKDQWRIQCRFGIDSNADGETPTTGNAAISVVEGAFEALAAGNQSKASRFFNFPCFSVDPGVIQSFADADELETNLPDDRVELEDIKVLQCGSKAVNLAINATLNGQEMCGIVIVTERGRRWEIEGGSIIIR